MATVTMEGAGRWFIQVVTPKIVRLLEECGLMLWTGNGNADPPSTALKYMAVGCQERRMRTEVSLRVVTKTVTIGEPKSIRRNLPSAQVNGNARPGNWPGVFISRCWQRVTAFPPPTPALSIPQARFRGPKATMTVAPVARKNGRELSDSLVNRLKRVNSRVAFGIPIPRSGTPKRRSGTGWLHPHAGCSIGPGGDGRSSAVRLGADGAVHPRESGENVNSQLGPSRGCPPGLARGVHANE